MTVNQKLPNDKENNMPYIKPDARHTFESHIQNLASDAENAGDLNYIITKMLHLYIQKKWLKYANCNEVIGALECCKLELYRKVIAKYENEKIVENGGVGIFPQYDEDIEQGVPVSYIREHIERRKQDEKNLSKAYWSVK